MPPVVVVAASYAASAAVGGGIIGALAATAISVAGSSLLAKKPSTPSYDSLASGVTSVNRSASDPMKVIYGERRVGGTLVFIETSDNDSKKNAYLHMVAVLAMHACESIGDIYFEDELVPFDASGNSVGNFKIDDTSYARIRKFTGANNNAKFSELRSESANWTNEHNLNGFSGVYTRLTYEQKVFPNGIPNVTAIVRGKKVYDPRDGQTKYSNNWALCVRDYLTNPTYGLNAQDVELDEQSFITAANISDEQVSLAGGGTTSRFTVDGFIDTSRQPVDILTELMSAAGGILVYTGGKYKLQAGVYTEPVADIDASWFAGDLSVDPRPGRADTFNAVKGVYAPPEKKYQLTDFPAVTNATYEAQDGGERLYRDIELPYTIHAETAQRIAKVMLEQSRQSIRCSFTANLKGLQISVGDRVRLTMPDLGWDKKIFRVTGWAITPEADTEISLQEDAPESYEWNNGMATTRDPAPNTNLPNPLVVEPPENLALSSGNDELYMNNDGTVMSRLKATWDESPDAFVTRYEVQSKKSGTTKWQPAAVTSHEERECHIMDVEDGLQHDVRVRALNAVNLGSNWVESLHHNVLGKSAPPSDVLRISVQQTQETVTFRWSEVEDRDLSGYEIRYAATNDWENGTTLTRKTKGTHVTSAAVPPGHWFFMIKAYDTSGNESDNHAYTTGDVINNYNVIHTQTNGPVWLGNLSGLLLNPMTNNLNPLSEGTAADHEWDVFDTFNPAPVSVSVYETPIIDILFLDQVRAWFEAVTILRTPEHSNVILETEIQIDGGDWQGHTVGDVEGQTFKFRLIMYPKQGGIASINKFDCIVDVKEKTLRGSEMNIEVDGTTVTFNRKFHETPHLLLSAKSAQGAARFAIYDAVDNTTFTARVVDASGTNTGGIINWTATGV